MKNVGKNKGLLLFLILVSFFTSVIFWQVFIKNQIPFNANLLASFYNPWAIEKFDGWEHGIPNKPTAKDDLWIFYPQRTFTTNVLKNWEIPFWNPYSFSGNYHLGLSETAVFYPLNFLFLIFPQINVWVFLTIIQPVIAGFGMYLFLKKMVLREKSAIFGALTFAFSGVVIVRSVEGLSVGHTLIWMPYVFWGIESFFQTKKTKFLWLILFFLSFSLLAGWFQYTFYIFVLALIYALFKLHFCSKHHKLKSNYLILIPFLFLPLVTFFHTIPAFQALLESPRLELEGRVFSHYHLMPLSHIFTLIIPDFWGNPAVYNYFGRSDYKESIMFMGIVPLVFSIISIIKRKRKEELFFILSIIISFVLTIDNPLSRLIISTPLPVFSSFLPNRIFLITTFSFAVLSAYGLDYILKEKKRAFIIIKKTFIFLTPIIIALTLLITLPILKDYSILNQVDRTGINISQDAIRFKNSIIPLFFFLITVTLFFVFKNRYSRNAFFIFLIAAFFLQNYMFAQKYIPFSDRQFAYPNHPVFTYLKEHQGLDRFMSIGSGHIVPSIPLQFGLYSPEGIGSMYIRRYGELVRYMVRGSYGIPDKIAFDLEIYPEEVFRPKNNRLNRFFELTSVKYIVVDKKSIEESKVVPEKSNFNLVWYNEKWQIYQYRKSMHRFFTTSNFEIISDKEKILNSLFSDLFSPNKIILEEDPGFKSKNYQGNLKITNYSPNKISMAVSTDNPTLIYFSENYSKAFRVFIDGKQGKILRSNYTFRAVPVPKGNHIVRFEYKTESFEIGTAISIVSLIFLMGAFIAGKKYI
ncbi:MAG: YfhO family protein [Candidatus Levybacteria bacterium]|nr:YfhO family protein [Candidatus Levybacteria bacterium]